MSFEHKYFNLGYLDILSYKSTVIHRIDPRAKLIATIAYIISVVSFPKYEISGLLPFSLFPVMIFSLGDIPVKFILKKVVFISSFAMLIGIFNPLLDKKPLYEVYGFVISGGLASFFSILLKTFLTSTAALLLIATTSFPGVCHALRKLGAPGIFVSQLLFLYRYIFVLTEEALRVVQARNLRSFGRKGLGIIVFVSIISTLLIKTIEKSERIYLAMLSRGFHGTFHVSRPYCFKKSDAVFLALTFLFLYVFRMYNIVEFIGQFSDRLFQGI